MTNGWLMMINVVKTMPQTTHLGMVYTTYLWWNWWWFIPVLPTLLHSKPQLGMALFFVFHFFFYDTAGFFARKNVGDSKKINQFPLGQLAPIRNDTQVFQNWFEETLWGKSDMGLFDFSSDIKMWWFITIFWKKLPCWGMPPLDKRNVFGLQKNMVPVAAPSTQWMFHLFSFQRYTAAWKTFGNMKWPWPSDWAQCAGVLWAGQ